MTGTNPARLRGRWIGWIGGAVLLAAFVAGVVMLATLPADRIRHWQQLSQFWVVEALLAAGLITTALAFPPLVRALRAGVAWWLGAVALAVLAFALISSLPPRTNRIFYDEQIYQDVGHNLADLRLAQMCNYGFVEYGQLQCLSGEYNKEPNGYPQVLSVVYRLFGVHDSYAHLVNRVAHALLVLVLCVLGARWFDDRRAGLFAGLAATLLPEQLRWAATAAAEPTAALTALIAVLAAVEYARARTTRALAWAVCASALAVQFRPESVLVLPVVTMVVLTHAPGEAARPRLWWAALAGAALLLFHAGHLLAVSHDSWGAPGAPFSLSYVAHNLSVNGWFYLWDPRFPPWLTVFAVMGLVAGAGGWRARTAAAAYFGIFWGIFLVFYAGSYNYGADVRYSLMTYPPLMLLTGLGLSRLAALPLIGRRRPALTGGLAALALGWAFTWQIPYVRATTEEAWGARADVEFAREVAASLPPTALVLTQDPNMFLLWGRNAAQLAMAAGDPAFLRQASTRHGGEIYVHWGFWCNVSDPRQQQLCKDALGRAPSTLVRERSVREYRYAFYKLR